MTHFSKYFEQHIERFLKDSEMVTFNQIPWSNNNAESMNSVIRRMVNFSPKKLEDLTRALKITVESQEHEEKAALHSLGDYSLVDIHRRYLVTNSK